MNHRIMYIKGYKIGVFYNDFFFFNDNFLELRGSTTFLSSIIAFCCIEINKLSVKSRQAHTCYSIPYPKIYLLLSV